MNDELRTDPEKVIYGNLHEEVCLSLGNQQLFSCSTGMKYVAVGLEDRAAVSVTWNITQDLNISVLHSFLQLRARDSFTLSN